MSVFLDRVNSVPSPGDGFSFEFNSWLSVLVDTLNETLSLIQNELNRYDNGLYAPQFTTAQITTLSATAADGTMWYDTTTNELKAKVNGVVVVIA
jgi:hypothetical protein